jgi:hypothetical protein
MGSHGIKNQPRAKMGEQQPESLIVVDVGNHHVKFARLGSADISAFPDDLPVLRLSSTRTPLEELAAWLPAGRAVWCVASVSRPVEARLADWVADQRPADNYLRLTNDLLPIEIRVEQPERVGTDRLLAALAAASLGTNEPPSDRNRRRFRDYGGFGCGRRSVRRRCDPARLRDDGDRVGSTD